MPIGMCGLLKRDWLADADVGFAFLPQYWSKGYAFESAAACMEWGRGTHEASRASSASRRLTNQGSMRVLEKLGLRPLAPCTRRKARKADYFTPSGRSSA